MIQEKIIKPFGVVINKENIVKMVTIIEKYYEDCRIDISLSNNSKLNDLLKEEFISYDFTNLTITEIEISANKKNEKYERIFFRFKMNDFFGNQISFEAFNKDTLALIENDINEWIRISSKFVKSSKFFANVWSIILLSIFFSISLNWIAFKLFSLQAFLYMFLSIIVCSIGVSNLLVWQFKKMFPQFEIDIGLNTAKKRRKMVWEIITLIALPFILSIIVSFVNK